MRKRSNSCSLGKKKTFQKESTTNHGRQKLAYKNLYGSVSNADPLSKKSEDLRTRTNVDGMEAKIGKNTKAAKKSMVAIKRQNKNKNMVADKSQNRNKFNVDQNSQNKKNELNLKAKNVGQQNRNNDNVVCRGITL